MKRYYFVMRRLRLMKQSSARWELYEEFDTYEAAHAYMMDLIAVGLEHNTLHHHYVVQHMDLPEFPDEVTKPSFEQPLGRKSWWSRLFERA